MTAKSKSEVEVVCDGHSVRITNPDKVVFAQAGITKIDLVNYYQLVAPGALRHVLNRPMALKRFVHGADGESFFQKRAPTPRPDWVDVVRLNFPSGRSADEVVVRHSATVLWLVNLGCLDLNPHAIRADDLEHPDELRIDLDPGPGVDFAQVKQVAKIIEEVLDAYSLAGYPKTSGSRGIHIIVRLQPRWGFVEVRRAALALAREAERRAPTLMTTQWWKEQRHGVFIDYNQNAQDKTLASAYSVRPTPQAQVSAPFTWSELPYVELSDFTVKSMATRWAKVGDVGSAIDETPGTLEPLLAQVAKDEAAGLGDAPWPPHYKKQPNEPPRVQPSKRKSSVA